MQGERPGGGDASLPPLFARWMQVLLPGPIPAERHATCDRCAMLPPGEGGPQAEDGGPFFSATTKCCTYMPELANFLVGRILADTSAEGAAGRATVEARIDGRAGVSPLGLHRTPMYSLLYRSSPASFGHASTMRCPHYLEDGGRCGVWRNRESTCVTWFCKYGRGWNGRVFWQRLHDTLSAAEDAVRTHCLLELGVSVRTLSDLIRPHALTRTAARSPGLSAADVDGATDSSTYDATWGDFRGRERELFIGCADVAARLEWPDIQRLGGVRLELLSKLLVDAYEALVSEAVPSRVRHRQLSVVSSTAETVNVVGYSSMDPLRIPRKLFDVLYHFDGRPTDVVLEEIADQHGLRVAPGVVRGLADFDLLTPVDSGAPTPGVSRDGPGSR